MTDNEIIKALECCIGKHNGCNDCPYRSFDEECTIQRNEDCVDLINRQQTEIMETRRDLLNEIYALEHQLETTKAEAIKEFAEIVKANKNNLFNYIYSSRGFNKQIDNLVKEMVGDTE